MWDRKVVVFTGKYTSPAIIEHVEAIARVSPLADHGPPRSVATQVAALFEGEAAAPEKAADLLLPRGPKQGRKRSARFVSPRSAAAERSRASNARFTRRARRSQPSRHYVSTLRVPAQRRHHRLAAGVRPLAGDFRGAPVLRANLFRIPEIGTINLHKSLLPRYRGMPPAFWESYHSEKETGASVHWVEESLDSGGISATPASHPRICDRSRSSGATRPARQRGAARGLARD